MKKKILSFGLISSIYLIVVILLSFLFIEDIPFLYFRGDIFALNSFFCEIFSLDSFLLFEFPYYILFSIFVIIFVFVSLYSKVFLKVFKAFLYVIDFCSIILFFADCRFTIGITIFTLCMIVLTILCHIYSKKDLFGMSYKYRIYPLILFFLIIGIFLLVYKIINIEEKFNSFAYVKNNSLIFKESYDSDSLVLSKNYFNDKDNEGNFYSTDVIIASNGSILFLENIAISNDERKGDLVLYDKEFIKIDENVSEFYSSSDNSVIVYLKNDALYVYNGSSSRIANNVKSFFINKAGESIVYLNYDKILYIYDIKNNDSKRINSEVDDFEYINFYDGNLYYYYYNEDSYTLYDDNIGKIDDNIAHYSFVGDKLYYLKKIDDKYNLYLYNNGDVVLLQRNIDELVEYNDKAVIYLQNGKYNVFYNDKSFFIGNSNEIYNVSISDNSEYVYFLKHIEQDNNEKTVEFVRYSLSNRGLTSRTSIDIDVSDYLINEDICYYVSDYNDVNQTYTLFSCEDKKLYTTSVEDAIFVDDMFLYITNVDDDKEIADYYVVSENDSILVSDTLFYNVDYITDGLLYINNFNVDNKRGDLYFYNKNTNEVEKIDSFVSYMFGNSYLYWKW